MSMRSRARALQRATGFSYQQALARIRELGAAPADLKRTTGWSLERCDEVLVSASLHAVISRHLPKRRAPSVFQRACDAIKERTAARTVIWIGADGSRAFAGQPAFLRRAGIEATRAVGQSLDELAALLAIEPPYRLHLEPVARAGALAVISHQSLRIGLVRLVARAYAALIEEALAKIWTPPRGGAPPSAAPAELVVGFAWPTWTPTVPRSPN